MVRIQSGGFLYCIRKPLNGVLQIFGLQSSFEKQPLQIIQDELFLGSLTFCNPLSKTLESLFQAPNSPFLFTSNWCKGNVEF